MKGLFRIAGFAPFIVVVFLNAMTDLGHKIVIQNTVFKSYHGQQQILLTALVNALILLPFIFFFTPSGFLADRYPRNRVLQLGALVAVVLTALITACYYLGLFWPAFALTFLLAVQSAFYSPAKYGYIRELAGAGRLAEANGMVQAVTMVAILAGVFLFSLAFEGRLQATLPERPESILRAIAPLGWALVALSLVELLLALRLPRRQPGDRQRRFPWSDYLRGRELRHNLALVRRHRLIWLSIVGLAVFWAIGQVILAAFPAFARDSLHLENAALVQGLLACTGIGIMAGSVVAARASRGRVELGLIPLGAAGFSIGLLSLTVLDDPRALGLAFAGTGFFGGLFIVPLNTLIQYHAGEQRLGTVLAANNLLQNLAMLAMLCLTMAAAALSVDGSLLLLGMGLLAAAGGLYTLWRLPQSLVRWLLGATFNLRYRIEVQGLDELPARGGVLLLGNHVSWIDWAVVQIASPRPVRFVMERSIYERWYLRRLLDRFGIIPITTAASGEALKEVAAALDRGEVVCLFPEGAISRTGQLGEFRRGFERAAAQASSGCIVPFYLRGLWGSLFSRASPRLRAGRSDAPRRDLIVAFGRPLPLESRAEQVKQAVSELSITAWQRHAEGYPTLAAAWIDRAARLGRRRAIADGNGEWLSHRRLLTMVLCLARRLSAAGPARNLGLLLPASTGAAVANLAALVAGRTVVNLNFTAAPEALEAAIGRARLDTIISSGRFLKRLEKKGFDSERLRRRCTLLELEELGRGVPAAEKLLTLLLVALLPARLLVWLYGRAARPEETAAILFSSGSEGVPKGVMLSHRNILANLRQVADVLNLEREDVVMASLPPFHAFGLTVTTFMPLVEGVPVVCHPDPTDAVNIARAVARQRVTILCGTSTFLRFHLRSRRVHPLMLEPLRVVVAGAEKLSEEVREGFRQKFGKPIYEGYGATETTPVASVNLPDRLDTRYWTVQRGCKPGTVGMPLPGTAFRIVDPGTLEELPRGGEGLILIGGIQVMQGYLGDPEKTAEVIVELDGMRWYRTGDKGRLDEDGFLTIVDRYSRFAKIGGEMVSLTAVEEAARKALGEGEMELAATALPDPGKGERVVLLAVTGEEGDDLRKRIAGAGTPALMVPARVIPVTEIPRLGSGKTDYKAARALALEQAGTR